MLGGARRLNNRAKTNFPVRSFAALTPALRTLLKTTSGPISSGNARGTVIAWRQPFLFLDQNQQG